MVVLDTNILIDYLRRPQDTSSPLMEFNNLNPQENKAISILTIQELYSGKSSKELEKEKLFLEIISFFEILPYNYEIAKLAGEIVRESLSRLDFPDAAIASTTMLNKAKLFTFNEKDFQGVKGLKLI